MASVNSLRDELALAIATTGLRASAHEPEQFNPPCAWVKSPTVFYDHTHRDGLHRYIFEVVVLVTLASKRAGQEALDEYLATSGTKSVKAAIEDYAYTSLTAQVLEAAPAEVWTLPETPNTTYLSVTFSVEVHA